MNNLKLISKVALLCLGAVLLAACNGEAEGGGVDYEVIGKSESGDAGTHEAGAAHITDSEMLEMAAGETGADIDVDSVDFETEHVFKISLFENGCGYLLDGVQDDGGVMKFMFELTPVVEEGEDPEDVMCTQIAIPAEFFVKTEAVDFSSLEIYGSGNKIGTE